MRCNYGWPPLRPHEVGSQDEPTPGVPYSVPPMELDMTLCEALAILCRAGRIASVWLPGMTYVNEGVLSNRNGLPYGPGWIPAVEDPATLGCLLAILREASGDLRAHVTYYDEARRQDVLIWVCNVSLDGSDDGQHTIWGRSEGEAIAAALIALAEALP